MYLEFNSHVMHVALCVENTSNLKLSMKKLLHSFIYLLDNGVESDICTVTTTQMEEIG